MPVQIHIELPDSAPAALKSTPEALAHELRLAAAVKWFELGKVSQGKAAELAGLSRAEFLDALARYRVSPFQLSPEDLSREMSGEPKREMSSSWRWIFDASPLMSWARSASSV